MKILIDADACPIKECIISISSEYQVPVILVSSIAHSMPEVDNVQICWVDNESQATDIKIINLMETNDIVVTGDIGLASLVLGKNGYAISYRGIIYEDQKMKAMLHNRYISSEIRKAGGKTKGPKPYQPSDRKRFEKSLRNLIERINL